MKAKARIMANEAVFVWQFALDDFKRKYAGSALGSLWAFLQPMVTILLYWFVFQLGFKSQPVANFPFILWLMTGLVPWFFISDAIMNATTSLLDYSYLVKKVLFNINILPFTKILSTLLIQIVLIGFMDICLCIGGYWPGLHCFQIIIYLLYMCILVTGISYITATLYVFFRDTVQIVSILIQAIFWLTPIVWNFESMPETTQNMLVFNPVYYCVSGFRSAFIYREWFSPGIGMNIYYWTICILILTGGINLFCRCREHFADVL